ncbi:MAG TPA: hypothetical protein VF200_04665 [Woeseiaceae bacterium]
MQLTDICFGWRLLWGLSVVLAGCAAGPEVIRLSDAPPGGGPYGKILVVSLFESFDMRRYLETELVSQLSEQGIEAVASTSMMDSKTPVNRRTFVDMVDKTGADSVLLTQPVDLETTAKKTTPASPQASYNFRPTYYYNVFSVELTEYAEPPGIRLEHDVTLLVELIGVDTREPVWAIQTRSRVVWKADMERDYSAYIDEAKTITREMAKDGVIAAD